MGYVRTQVYLVPSQHGELKREARRRELSLAEFAAKVLRPP